MFQRDKEFCCASQSGELMKQYEVKHFCEAEVKMLSYLEEHQGQPRASAYSESKRLGYVFEAMKDEAIMLPPNRLFIFLSTHLWRVIYASANPNYCDNFIRYRTSRQPVT